MGGKLTKSSTDRVFSGVCGGIAEFTGISAWAIRILFLLLPSNLLIYIILAFVMPEED
ncbi:PspC domain-containing protein [Marinilactibacillus psychrotolerans]|nr:MULTISPECIES: PspC domain-containing protein [Marinilactibacillus]API90024.1 PspC domain-containing protein [Marinilactibacillus sp. 15R]TLQ09018.1 PspC domain-containing protein [Marinilactibacillus psychrotolerans]SDD01450.1 phage shock protein C (PspC) family protein [Marinilactibacillus psychrotolerans]SFK42880.1 Phage shock protein PspC (stress-responsive transcriptional regulator) [Marinilactibacillus piezotolerans]GEL67414.1 hypothetical protein MPS01_15690 [Marinilactibacillus psych